MKKEHDGFQNERISVLHNLKMQSVSLLRGLL